MEKVFSNSEKRVISAMYQLDRWATINEISDWEDMSWNTVKSVLTRLKRKKIVESKKIKGQEHWRIIE